MYLKPLTGIRVLTIQKYTVVVVVEADLLVACICLKLFRVNLLIWT